MVIFTFTLFSYLVSSYYLAFKINKERYLSLWLILFFVSIILSVEILGTFNVFSSFSLFIFALINLILITIANFHNLKKIGEFTLPNILQTIKITNLSFVLLVFLAIVVIYSTFLPISEIDSVSYHLPIVSKIISTGGIWEPFHAGYVGPNTFFPANHEAIQAFFTVQNGNMNRGYIVTLLSFFLLLTSLFDLGRKRISKLFIFVITLSCVSVPFLFNQFLNLQIDLFMFALFGSAVALILSSFFNDDKLDLAKGFLVLGILLGSKYNAVPQIIILIPILILLFFYHRRQLKSIFWYPLLTIVSGLFWYIRNWIIADNPIYPFGLNFGFINFEGHKVFIEDTIGTSLWNFIVKDGIYPVFSHILNNGEFELQLGKVSLLLFPVALLAVIGALIFVFLNKLKDTKNNRKSLWNALIFVLLFYVFFAEIFYYLNSPYTYTLWHQTIRYASPVFALVPIFFVLAASYSRIIRIVLFYFASTVLVYNILFKSFLFKLDNLQLIFDKVALIPDVYILLLIFAVIFVVFLFSSLMQLKTYKNLPAFILLFVISLTISAYQFYLAPHFPTNTAADDNFLLEQLNIYPAILPHIEKLRGIKNNNESEKIALSGLTPYWLFEKEGYSPIYVNIDGCIECQYFYYRNEDNSIRANPNASKWKEALKELHVKYLIVDFVSYSKNRESYEENWAKNDKKMFTLLLKTDSVSLYRIN